MRALLLATLLASALLFVSTREAVRPPPAVNATTAAAVGGETPEAPSATPADAATMRVAPSKTAPAAEQTAPAVASTPVAATRPAPAPRASARSAPAAVARELAPVPLAGPPPAAPPTSPESRAITAAIASAESQATLAPLARLYLAYFHRAPDYEGFDYYATEREDGATLEAIAEEFAGSAEFNTRYGELDNASFVDRIHRNVTGSAADMAQRAFWVGELDAGRMTRGQVMLAFSESAEFRSLTGNEVFVTLAYAEALRREPAPAEFVRWVDYLDAGHPRTALVDALLAGRPPVRP